MQNEMKPIDKSTWGDGPWQTEPDRVEFEHLGFPCLIVRVPHSGHLCGYVAVPPGHPAYRLRYDSVNVDVHGGLTYSESCQGQVCHVPKPGEADDVWWLGFDHAHLGDLCPYRAARDAQRYRETGDSIWLNEAGYDTYKTVAYVTNEIKKLAQQLRDAAVARDAKRAVTPAASEAQK